MKNPFSRVRAEDKTLVSAEDAHERISSRLRRSKVVRSTLAVLAFGLGIGAGAYFSANASKNPDPTVSEADSNENQAPGVLMLGGGFVSAAAGFAERKALKRDISATVSNFAVNALDLPPGSSNIFNQRTIDLFTETNSLDRIGHVSDSDEALPGVAANVGGFLLTSAPNSLQGTETAVGIAGAAFTLASGVVLYASFHDDQKFANVAHRQVDILDQAPPIDLNAA